MSWELKLNGEVGNICSIHMIWNAKPTGFIEHIYLDNILDSNLNCKFLNTQILKIINPRRAGARRHPRRAGGVFEHPPF